MKGECNLSTTKKSLNDLTLLDRFLFAEAVEDPEIMRLILEIILGQEIRLDGLPQTEKENAELTPVPPYPAGRLGPRPGQPHL